MAASLVRIIARQTLIAVSRSRYSSPTLLPRPMADFGRRQNSQNLRNPYKRDYSRGQEQYKKEFFKQYESELPPNLRQQIPAPRQSQPIPVPFFLGT